MTKKTHIAIVKYYGVFPSVWVKKTAKEKTCLLTMLLLKHFIHVLL